MLKEQDPMMGIKMLQQAITHEGFNLDRVPFEKDMYTKKDLGGERRTYAYLVNRKVKTFIVFSKSEPLNGLPCWCVFYGVPEGFRRQGLAASLFEKSIKHLSKQMKSKPYYIEAIVEKDNLNSNSFAAKYISNEPKESVDSYSNREINAYHLKCNS